MKNVGGSPQFEGQPKQNTLFITLWDLSIPPVGATQGTKKLTTRTIEFPLIANGAQLWVRPEGESIWTQGPVASAEVEERDEDAQRVKPTLVDFAALLPDVKADRFEIAVEPQALSGLQLGGYYESPDRYVPTRDAERLIKVVQWGTTQWTEMYEAFADCVNMQINATDQPDLSRCDSLHSAFMGSGVVEGFKGWNVATVLDMSAMFYGCTAFVGKSIAEWDVHSVESMAMMFMECECFDGKLGHWNVANVVDFTSIFSGCSQFRGRGVERWQVQEDAEKEGAFDGCFALQEGLPAWMGVDDGSDDSYDDPNESRVDRGGKMKKFRRDGADDD